MALVALEAQAGTTETTYGGTQSAITNLHERACMDIDFTTPVDVPVSTTDPAAVGTWVLARVQNDAATGDKTPQRIARVKIPRSNWALKKYAGLKLFKDNVYDITLASATTANPQRL